MDIIWLIRQIILLYISFIFIEIKFIYYCSSVMFIMKSMSISND